MSDHEWEPALARIGDAEQRFVEDEEHAALDHRREMAFHLSDPKPAPRMPRRGRNTPRPDRLWKERVLERDQGCCVHANPKDCDEGFQAHHVVAQQELRRTAPAELWNVSVGMGVCGLAHRRHHSCIERIPLAAVPIPVVAHLRALGFGDYLERRYA